MASESIKEADSKWQKKAGFDLRLDKTKILKKALASVKKDGQNLPKTSSAQVFKRKWERKTAVRSDEVVHSWQFVKRIAMKKLRNLRKLCDPDIHRKKLRGVEGLLLVVTQSSGTFTDTEADEIVDTYILCQESPSLHPLQTAIPKGSVSPKFRKTCGGIFKSMLFGHIPLRSALARRGYFLNHGLFSSAESMQLMKNFDAFLRTRGYSTDPESKWNLMKDGFATFYRKTKLFLYVGRNLNRSSDQLLLRLISLHHTLKRSTLSAEEDSFLIREAEVLKNEGVHKRFKCIGGELGRLSVQVKSRHCRLTSSKCHPPDPLKLNKAIADLQERNLIASLEDIPFEALALKYGMSENDLRLYWIQEGKQLNIRSKLPRWTLKDTIELLNKIKESGEDEENCVDFEGIFDRHFQGRAVDWKHLREHFGRVRRVVPYYMLDDLQSVVSVAKKHVKKQIRKREKLGTEAVTGHLECANVDEDVFEP